MSARRVLMAWPCRRTENVEWVEHMLKWPWTSKADVRPCLDTKHGVDVARSRLIEIAREMTHTHWVPEVFIMLDTDMICELPFDTVMSYVAQDFARGYGVVGSPAMSHDGQISVMAPDGAKPFLDARSIPSDDVFEVDWVNVGLSFWNVEDLLKLKPLAAAKHIDGDPTPMYCLSTPDVGEDVSLCRNFRQSTGKKVGADPRIPSLHFKWAGRPSWRASLAKQVGAPKIVV